jgi:hypothetical protein
LGVFYLYWYNDTPKTFHKRWATYYKLEFAQLVCGDNEASVYKSSSYITKFFNYLEYPYTHDGATRRLWVKDVLSELKSEDLYRIFLGLVSKELHIKIGLESPDSNATTEEFRKILRISLNNDGIPKFSENKNLEIKQEKLQDENDRYLDSLLDQSEKFYFNGQKKEAINNIYDAFERIKTHYDKNKKTSTTILINHLSKHTGINLSFFEERFKNLNGFCNDYNIRHHDKKVIILKEFSYDYVYHDILNLLNLIINVIKKERS